MKKITTGIIAHVDAGKTTLSEALLYRAGNIRNLGRVDNGDAFLDTQQLEKKRGITIFSHEAKLTTDVAEVTLLDTPGHVDFAFQTEEVLSVLDYAILVISATDGVTSYAKTLWNLLEKNNVPVFIFINKIDIAGTDKDQALADIQKNLSENCLDFSQENQDFYENVASADDKLLEKYLNGEKIADSDIQDLIAQRKIYPVYFGSALKLTGITEFLTCFDKWTKEKEYASDFSARCFKISHDKNRERLSWIKILGGSLKAKTELADEKINQLREYNGEKFTTVVEAKAGDIVAATGLTKTYPGQGFGAKDANEASLKPVLTYRLNPLDEDIHACLTALKKLEDENPQLHVTWSEHLQELRVQVMGKIQLEILKQLLQERFNLTVDFEQGSILYKETIAQPVEGAGHFEPLRHYAEVHLLLEPGLRNSGVVFENNCSLEVLTKNWQHQIMTALKSKEHLGVLLGTPITDVKITLLGGKGSIVHSVGGDFREATYRAVRQGLMELKEQDQLILLEPWYDFRLEVSQEHVGRALNDIQRMSGQFKSPENKGDRTIIEGSAPVSEMQDYAAQVRGYTHGDGIFECVVKGYLPCHNAQEIIEQKNYDPVSDLENTPNSVFCSHGAGHTVTWDKVPETAHYPYTYPLK
ncbi:TetM/TetW/TetO/TetS family tetracycline resistance ribosomal protection protein [Lactobacillus amylovorus]|uniref:TetM/TetW/TetO/TetS family tetracycline resistance ribosomal protection protein n=1 Tax=Lactobacillus amylovorus TaxID=1604 RepID=A0AAW6BBB5_LACAM|nr:TetM/TetW/TetO/TetS family tetracycline resistance ribosomal protection protein [Lactobacillus amylovorus]MDA6089978.1 TetM/TetW/TetO/TetS family tetracycline resistance ribosomal protection protein [Lactobacillus amylovorus]MDB6247278.1 TetM/TetW/TetO/TetS family tetracycline resistance ribosomal protection protein [Lactobacillus amylovorus]